MHCEGVGYAEPTHFAGGVAPWVENKHQHD